MASAHTLRREPTRGSSSFEPVLFKAHESVSRSFGLRAQSVYSGEEMRAHSQPLSAARVPYHAGLDGLRALCVIAIMLYHAELSFLPGGFLGVEVFFVVSGYLITSLLRAELESSARIDLLDFWRRRARRLLPA